MRGLGDLAGGPFESRAFDVSEDGRVVVGSGTGDQGAEAFVWDRVYGLRRLADVLTHAGITGLERWRLTDACGISADGRWVVGSGTNPDGKTEGWLARLP